MPTGSVRIISHDNRHLRMAVTVQTKTMGTVVRLCCFTRLEGGYEVESTDERGASKEYWIDTTHDQWGCSCPDAQSRNPGGCKHILALKTGLAKVGD